MFIKNTHGCKMLALSSTSKIFVCQKPTDMRKSYDGLSNIVANNFQRNSLSGDFYVFTNRKMNLLKILFWDAGGYCLFCKRLEKGRFRFPVCENQNIDRANLQMILEGIDLKSVKRLPRYMPK